MAAPTKEQLERKVAELEKQRKDLQMGVLLLALPLPGIFTTIRFILNKRKK